MDVNGQIIELDVGIVQQVMLDDQKAPSRRVSPKSLGTGPQGRLQSMLRTNLYRLLGGTMEATLVALIPPQIAPGKIGAKVVQLWSERIFSLILKSSEVFCQKSSNIRAATLVI